MAFPSECFVDRRSPFSAVDADVIKSPDFNAPQITAWGKLPAPPIIFEPHPSKIDTMELIMEVEDRSFVLELDSSYEQRRQVRMRKFRSTNLGPEDGKAQDSTGCESR